MVSTLTFELDIQQFKLLEIKFYIFQIETNHFVQETALWRKNSGGMSGIYQPRFEICLLSSTQFQTWMRRLYRLRSVKSEAQATTVAVETPPKNQDTKKYKCLYE